MNRNLAFDFPEGIQHRALSAGHAAHPAWMQPGLPALAPAARLRSFLIVALTLTMPVCRVLESGDRKANMAASDLVMPLGVSFLVWGLLKDRVRLPLAAVFCLSISSIIVSSVYNLDTSLATRGIAGMAMETAKIAYLWVHFFLIVNLISGRRDFLLLLKTWALGSGAVALCGIGGSLAYQIAGIETPFSLMFRAQGTLNDCNLYVAHLAASFFLTFLYRTLLRRTPAWFYPLLVTQVAGIFFAASRGGTLSFGLTSALLLACWASRKAKLTAGLAIAALALCFALIPDKDALLESNPITARLATTTVSLDDSGAAERRELWGIALEGFFWSPFFGIGRGNFGYLNASDTTAATHVHNTYLGILCETGIIGFAIYMLFFSYPVFALLRSQPCYSDPSSRRGAHLLLAALAVVAFSGVTISIENYRGLWILIGLSEPYRKLYAEDGWKWGAGRRPGAVRVRADEPLGAAS